MSASSLIDLGIKKGYIKLYERNGIKYIEYVYAKKKFRFDRPEERVRAEVYVELIEKYGYPPEKIRLEEYPPTREGARPSDIVVYDKDDFPYIVIEVKKEDCTEDEIHKGIKQLFGNANLFGVKWALFDCRKERRAYFTLTNFSLIKESQLRKPDIPKAYGQAGKFTYGNGVGVPLSPFRDISEFQRIIKKCHDILRDNENLSPLQAFPVISRIIYTKIYDELHTPTGEYYQFQIGSDDTDVSVASRIAMLYKRAASMEPEIFSQYLGIEKPQTIFEIVGLLQRYSFYHTPYDVKGEAYQAFLGKLMRGELGQYFTPREVVKPTVEILDPSETEKIIDPCCGTGGFLIYAFKFLRNKIRSKYNDERVRVRKEYDVSHYNIYGIEIDRNVAEACIAGMLLEDDAHGNIAVTDALAPFNNRVFMKQGIKSGMFHVLMTNPPFGKKGRLKEYKNRFELAQKFKTPPFEALILERALELLAPGGRMGIVIPDINLTDKRILEFIWEKTIILGVVSLPSETFNPYGSGAKTSVLFLKKKKTPSEKTRKIFMAKIYQIGYDATGRIKGDGKNYYEVVAKFFRKFLQGENIEPIITDKFAVFTIDCDKVSSIKENLKVESYLLGMNVKETKEIKYVPLKEVADVYRGYTPGWHDYTDSGIPILKVRNLTNKVIEFNFEKRGYVPESIYEKHPEAHIKLYDILLVASAHKPEYIAKKIDIVDTLPFDKCMAVAELLIIRPKKNIDPFYLLAVLRMKEINEQFRGCIRGTTAHIYPDDVKERVLIPRLPPEDEKEIADSLREALKIYRKFESKFNEHLRILKEKFKHSFQ